MELMQKYVKDDGVVGIDNLDRWPTRSAAVEFLSATTSAGSFEELKRVCPPSLAPSLIWNLMCFQQRLFTEIRWSTGDLVSLAWFALISARTFYSYTPPSDEDE